MNLTNLKKLAEAATPGPWIEGGRGQDNLDKDGLPIEYDAVYPVDEEQENDIIAREVQHDDCKFIAAANPQTILAMIEVMEQMGEALKWHTAMTRPIARTDEALAAYNKLKEGE